MNAINIAKHLPKSLNRAGLLLVKHSPEILTGVGIISFGVSTVLACKATTKIDDILEEHNSKNEIINETLEKEDVEYTEEDYKKDKIILKVQTGKNILKEYAPAVGFTVLGVTCVLSGHNIMRKRNVALAAAYTLANSKLTEYRKRVVESLGVEKDKEFCYGLKTETIKVKEEGEDGKTHTVKKTVSVVDPNDISIYARFFDDASRYWVDDAELNLMFLKSQQAFANNFLHSHGHIFLNEIYDALGLPRTKEGAIVGWVISEDSDNFVDFGIYSAYNDNAIDFVNGYEKSILLDFNVDGVIYDLI